MSGILSQIFEKKNSHWPLDRLFLLRFLSTLERHFKNICYGASFHVVTETIPSMMNSLRMIWIISRHYNKDERMVPLMERIAWELSERVSKVINVKKILE